jgi:two-component system, cell cycle sensor histidine kinase and response regulator CckA
MDQLPDGKSQGLNSETGQSPREENSRIKNNTAGLDRDVGTLPGYTLNSRQKYLSEFAAFAVENMSDSLFLIAKDARIVYVNRAACELLGYTEEELLGLTILDIHPNTTMEEWYAAWDATLHGKPPAIEVEHRAKDGRIIPVELIANFIEIGGELYSCSFTREITKRREMEARIRQSEKMEALGQLAGGIAHDFNNQLAGMLGYADLLRLELTDRTEAIRYVESIVTGIERSSGLIAQLLAFARQGKYLSVPVDLHTLIDETVRMLDRSINKNIRIVTRFQSSRAVTIGDPSQIENMLLNLAINARDAMPSGGELAFSTCTVDLDEAYCAGSTFGISPGTYIRVDVTDTGTGMPAGVQARLFEPFFTTKEKGKGTGMGLASVYGTIKMHKGAIEVRSQVGFGTTVTIYLPHSKNPVAVKKSVAPKRIALTVSARVLLVDDEPLVQQASKKLLEYLGCSVVTASNGTEALAFFSGNHRDIDLVILDLVLPKISGKETFLKMRSIDPELKVIIASGYSIEGEVQEMLELGVRGFLQKPFSLNELAQIVSETVTIADK